MPTLLQISVTAGADSTGRCADLIGRVAQSHGWRSVIAYGRRKPVTTSETIRIGNVANVAFHGVVSRLADAHGRSGRHATEHFIARAEELNPDVIHLHNIHGYYLHYPTLFRWLRTCGRPIVWTMHDAWPFTGHCAFPDAVNCSRWRRGCGNCPMMRQYPASWFVDASRANFADKMTAFRDVPAMTLVPVSKWLEDMLPHSPLRDYQHQVIYNGIDTTLFTPSLTAPTRPTAVAFASPWAPRKGLEHFCALRGLLPDDWCLIAVGLSHHQLRHLPAGIEGLPKSDPATVAKLMREASVTVVPSLADNYPTVILESQACGTPVALFDTGGCAEAVTPLTGCVAPVGDTEALANAVMQAAKLNRADCANAAVQFDYNVALEDYIKLYESVIKK